MKTLLLMRHAKSSWKFPELTDHDRPLNNRGKQDAPRMGEFLREQALIPDVIISSTAKRARRTARAVAEAMHPAPDVQQARELYFGSLEDWIEHLRSCHDTAGCVMLVGHNPGMEEFLERLTGEYEPLPTATVACVQLPIETWEELSTAEGGRLVHVWRPKELTR